MRSLVNTEAVDELSSYSQNEESEYKRAINLCESIAINRIKYEKEMPFSELNKWKKEARLLHEHYLAQYTCRLYVKNRINGNTITQLAQELSEIYEANIKNEIVSLLQKHDEKDVLRLANALKIKYEQIIISKMELHKNEMKTIA
jgi:arsenate reductase-like glutaredoxin family protein